MVKNFNWVNQPSKWPIYPEVIFCFPVFHYCFLPWFAHVDMYNQMPVIFSHSYHSVTGIFSRSFSVSVSIQTLSGTPLRLKVDDKNWNMIETFQTSSRPHLPECIVCFEVHLGELVWKILEQCALIFHLNILKK